MEFTRRELQRIVYGLQKYVNNCVADLNDLKKVYNERKIEEVKPRMKELEDRIKEIKYIKYKRYLW